MPMSAVPPLDLGKISRGPSVAFLDGAQSSSNSLDVSRRLPASHRYHQQQQQAPCMSLTELGVDIAKLQSAGVSDGYYPQTALCHLSLHQPNFISLNGHPD